MLLSDPHEMKTDFEKWLVLCAGAVCRPPKPANHLHGSQAGLCRWEEDSPGTIQVGLNIKDTEMGG